ncbi:MAG TPA: sialidase family protein [Acidimicrobiales bacterium]|nr:sialidase family protein [Acidimicrobiales bacterium]
MKRNWKRGGVPAVGAAAALSAMMILPVGVAGASSAKHPGHKSTAAANSFGFGQLQSATVGASGCGTNTAGEPSIHVSKANLVGAGSEEGLGGGSEYWRATQVGGSASASPCALVYSGQPNAVSGVGASGGDIDTAFAPVRSTAGTYRIYVASLNLGSVNVATSNDDGATFTQVPVQGGLPVDDREWIAAYGADTSLLSFHDISTDNIDILRSDTGGGPYTEIAQVIPPTDYKASNNELGNLVIDHNSGDGSTTSPFYAYQAFVAPSSDPGLTGNSTYNEAFLGVSADGGHTWTDQPIPCSTAFGANGLDHNFPNVSVAPNGTIYYAVSNDISVYVAMSADHGSTWTCSGPISTPKQAIYPWIVATSAGEDLVYYGTDGSGTTETWYVYFAQNTAQTLTGWSTTQITSVHQGQVCEGGVSCTGGRQLFDDFGVDTDQQGWAHIAYSHDGPDLGGSGSYTGYAVQQAGTPVGAPN